MTLRIVHSSDWHLGASFEGVSRREDHELFFAWLRETLRSEGAEVLVIAGDIFDVPNPSSEAQETWFDFLGSLTDGPVRDVVVVAGNHDSPARLEAPTAILDRVGVHVVGAFTEEASSRSRMICPVAPDAQGRPRAVVLAVPYLHEYRLGIRTGGVEGEVLEGVFRQRFTELYRELTDEAIERYPGVPLIGTGHLTCLGSEANDYPKAIHMVGTIEGLPEEVFDPRLRYVALGHIHRMMPVGSGRAWYCGTPIPFNLREAGSTRHVLCLDVDAEGDSTIRPRALPVPCFRSLRVLRGEPDQVISDIEGVTWTEPLPPFLVAELELSRGMPEETARVRMAHSECWGSSEERPRLVRIRQLVEARGESGQATGLGPASLRSMTPEEVFLRLCEHQGEPADPELLGAFRTILGAEQSP